MVPGGSLKADRCSCSFACMPGLGLRPGDRSAAHAQHPTSESTSQRQTHPGRLTVTSRVHDRECARPAGVPRHRLGRIESPAGRAQAHVHQTASAPATCGAEVCAPGHCLAAASARGRAQAGDATRRRSEHVTAHTEQNVDVQVERRRAARAAPSCRGRRWAGFGTAVPGATAARHRELRRRLAFAIACAAGGPLPSFCLSVVRAFLLCGRGRRRGRRCLVGPSRARSCRGKGRGRRRARGCARDGCCVKRCCR